MSAPTSWRTALTEATDDGVRIRGYDLRDLVGRIGFAEGIVLMARGELPTEGEAEEMTRESGWRHVPNAEVVYDGPPARPLPPRGGAS
jgi:citrate synthase